MTLTHPRLHAQLLLDSIKDQAIYMLDAQGCVATWTAAAERMLGHQAQAIIGQPASVFYSPDEAAAGNPQRALGVAAAQGAVAEEGWRVRQDGSRFWAAVETTAVYDEQGALRGYARVIRDAAARKQTEAALREREERLRVLADATPNGLIILAEGGEITWANRRAEALFGYEHDQLVGRPIDELVPARFAGGHPAHRETFLAARRSRLMGAGRDLFGLRRDGAEFPVEIGLSPIETEHGRLTLASVNDITERKQAEEALRQSEERFETAFRASPAALAVTRLADGCFVDANDQMLQLLGYRRDEVIGQTSIALGMYPNPADREEWVRSVRADGMLRNFELTLATKAGQTLNVLFSTVAIELAGEPHVLVTLLDGTERKRAEETLRQMNVELEARVRQRTAELAANEAKLRALFDVLPVGVSILDQQRRIVESNPALARILKMSDEGLAAGAYASRKFIRPDGSPMPQQEFASIRAFEEQRPVLGIEIGVVTEPGETIWTDVSAAPLPLDGQGVVVVTTDVTARKRAEAALMEGGQRDRSLFEAAQRQTQELTLRDLMHQALARELALPEVVRVLVEGIADTFGYTLVSLYLLDGEVLRLQHQVGYHQVIDTVHITQGVSGRVVRSGRPVLLGDVREDPAFLGAIEGIISEICVPLFDQGQVAGILNVESTHGIRLTEADLRLMLALGEQVGFALGRARLAAQVRESQQRFASAFSHASIGMALVAPDGRWLQVNPALCRLVGYSEDELLASSFQAITHPDDLAADLEHVRQMLAGTIETYQMEKRYFHKLGHVVWILLSVSLVHDAAGQPKYFISQIQDITDRKRAQAQLMASLQEKEALLKEVHHRVKNNLQVVSSLLHLQAETVEDPRLRALFDDSQRRVRSMALIHEQLYQSADLARIDFGEYVTGLVSYLRRSHAPPAARLRMRVEIENVTLEIDQAIPLGLLVNELLTNSLKYAFPPGAGVAPNEIWVAASRDAAGALTVSVGDNGAGMPDALDLDHPASMGLQLVQSFVTQLRGTLSVRRRPGTVYTVTIPEGKESRG